MLDNYKEVVEALEDTNESVLSHASTRSCACYQPSAVELPLTLFASIWGMNVDLPFERRVSLVLDDHRRDARVAFGMVGYFGRAAWL